MYQSRVVLGFGPTGAIYCRSSHCTSGPFQLSSPAFESWLQVTPAGLYCVPGRFHVDPSRPVARAVVTHAHADHARPGHEAVLATTETVALMRLRCGEDAATAYQALPYGARLRQGEVTITLHPAGHILGSAQVALEFAGRTAVVAGDYKRQRDPTCAPFAAVRCGLFVTEATFGLPVFRHGDPARQVHRLLASRSADPDRAHLVGVYGIGKCQRMLALLREAGYDRPVFLHGALLGATEVYRRFGLDPGEVVAVRDTGGRLAGEIVLCPPSALRDRWSRRLADPLTAFASGFMRVRARARQRGVELPLVVSDHADWPALIATVAEVEAEEVWVTHGREEALVYELGRRGLRARALALPGREEDAED
jgi:putative mRNA 3-end processing factor